MVVMARPLSKLYLLCIFVCCQYRIAFCTHIITYTYSSITLPLWVILRENTFGMQLVDESLSRGEQGVEYKGHPLSYRTPPPFCHARVTRSGTIDIFLIKDKKWSPATHTDSKGYYKIHESSILYPVLYHIISWHHLQTHTHRHTHTFFFTKNRQDQLS